MQWLKWILRTVSGLAGVVSAAGINGTVKPHIAGIAGLISGVAGNLAQSPMPGAPAGDPKN